jgi:hypothetical protein
MNSNKRVQHYKTEEQANAKIERLGIASAKSIECITKAKSAKPIVKTDKSKKAKKTKKTKKTASHDKNQVA